jgi:hypothetical protein
MNRLDVEKKSAQAVETAFQLIEKRIDNRLDIFRGSDIVLSLMHLCFADGFEQGGVDMATEVSNTIMNLRAKRNLDG